MGTLGTEHLEGIKPVPGGGYIAVSTLNSPTYSGDIDNGLLTQGFSFYAWLVKMDKDFRIEWQRIIRWPTNAYIVKAKDVFVTRDSSYVVIGTANDWINNDQSDTWVRKYDKKGKLLWSYEPVNFQHHDYLLTGVELSSGEIMLAGYQLSGTTAAWLVKLSAQGQLLWSKTFATTGLIRTFRAIAVTPDNNLVMAGEKTDPNGVYTDAYMVKADTAGNVIWEKTQGIFHNDIAYSIIFNNDNTMMVGCTSDSYGPAPPGGHHGGQDIYVLKIDANGNTLKTKFFGGFNREDHPRLFRANDPLRFYCIAKAQSVGGNISGNYGEDDLWLLHLDNELNLIWEKNYGGSLADQYPFGFYADSTIIIAGRTVSKDNDVSGLHGNNFDVWLAKLGYLNRIAGYVFQDRNNNGIKEATEPFFSAGIVTAVRPRDSSIISQIPLSGKFNLTVDTGIYHTSFYTNIQSYTVSPASVSTSRSNYFNVDSAIFALTRVPGISDLQVTLVPATRARPGFKVSYEMVVVNIGSNAIAAGNKVNFIKDALTDFSLFSSPPVIIGDTAHWNLPDLAAGDSAKYVVELQLQPPPALNIGDTVLLQAHVPLTGDYDSIDNHVDFHQIISGSFDPNDKEEAHAGKIKASEVMQEQYLTYTIRFQNMGNDTAFNITVKDTLSPKLNWASFEILRMSHPAVAEIVKGKIVNWTFNRIYLPPVNINEPASHGYITYRIRPRNTLAPGEIITNQASIYFDYNLPVQTNIENTVVVSLGILPVRLSKFEGILNNGIVNLYWKTATEQKTKLFEIERSADGLNFEKIGSVPATNFANGAAYAFKDQSPLASYNYYRLKIIDEDGKYSYSTIVVLNIKKHTALTSVLYPNPSPNGVVSISINGKLSGVCVVNIVDMNGREVMKKDLGSITADSYSTTLNLGMLQKGMYLMQFVTNSEVITHKMIIR
ncbi:MAG: T9SS type A sorting domain-containing protein [Chitinophagaceae bacterium]